ncbi:MAG TPA: LuxR C-terminal-related transcriptional regulator [Thermoanaerobaculia bacterium]|nr:LuxR C-terminal-related transcriptional regulator [Thermoanaerobaculia bacterium]
MLVTSPDRQVAMLEHDASNFSWLKTVVDDVSDGFLIETGEEITYVNRAYATMLHYSSPQELAHQHISAIVAPVDATRLLEFGRKRSHFENAPSDYNFVARAWDEALIPLHASISTSCVNGRAMIATLARPVTARVSAAPGLKPDALAPHQRLSNREVEVFEMILAGKRMKEIALELNVSHKTVSTHRSRLLAKMDLTDNRALFKYAVGHGLIHW